MRAMVKKLAMLLAAVDAAIMKEKEKKGEGVCPVASVTYPDAVVRKMLKRTAKASEVRKVSETRLPFWRAA
jgi:hypothetical protein